MNPRVLEECSQTMARWGFRLSVGATVLGLLAYLLREQRAIARRSAREAVDGHERWHPDHGDVDEGL